MKKIYSTTLFVLFVLVFLGCKKETEYFLKVKTGIADLGKDQRYDNVAGVPGVNIRLFKSELDYKLNQNPTHEGTTDGNGEFETQIPADFKFWVRARKDTLNELRIADNSTETNYGMYQSKKRHYDAKKLVLLSNTPVRLELQIPNRKLSEWTDAQLYLSEEDYKNNVVRYKVGTLYMSGIDINSDSKSIIFENLEPRRQYWFKVTSGDRSNANTVFKTNGPLEDNPDITNVITVSVE